MADQQKFFEVIKSGTDIDFIGTQKYWIGASITLVLVTFLMLPINAYVLKDRGHVLNWGVDFKGGTELVVEFNKTVDAAQVRDAMSAAGLHNADVVKYGNVAAAQSFMIRLGAVSIMTAEQAKKVEANLARVGDASLRKLDSSEGGDKIYLRFDKNLEANVIKDALKAAGTEATQVQCFGPPEDHTYEVTLIGMEGEVRKALDAKGLKHIPISGMDLTTGMPKVITITDEDVRKAIKEPTMAIVEAVRRVLEKMSPDLASDVAENGIWLAGGGALLKGLRLLLHQITGLEIKKSEDPLRAVIRGAGAVTEHFDFYRTVFLN